MLRAARARSSAGPSIAASAVPQVLAYLALAPSVSLDAFATAEGDVKRLHNHLFASGGPSRRAKDLLSNDFLTVTAKALSRAICLTAPCQDTPGPAFSTMRALADILCRTLAHSKSTRGVEASTAADVLSAQALARTELFANVARVGASVATQLTESASHTLSRVQHLQVRIECAGILLELFNQLAICWPARVLAGNTISQCAAPTAELAVAVLKLSGRHAGTTTTPSSNSSTDGAKAAASGRAGSRSSVQTGSSSSSSSGPAQSSCRLASALTTSCKCAVSAGRELVFAITQEVMRTSEDFALNADRIQLLSPVTRDLLGSTALRYLTSAHLAMAAHQQQQQQVGAQQETGPQTAELPHVHLLRALGFQNAAEYVIEFKNGNHLQTFCGALCETITASAVYVKANADQLPVIPCDDVIPVLLTLLDVVKHLQNPERQLGNISTIQELIDMCVVSAGQIRFEVRDGERLAHSCNSTAALDAAETLALALFKPVLRLLPTLASAMRACSSSSSTTTTTTETADAPMRLIRQELVGLVASVLPRVHHGAEVCDLLTDPTNLDLLPGLELAVRVAAENDKWPLAAVVRMQLLFQESRDAYDSSMITAELAATTAVITTAVAASAAGGGDDSSNNRQSPTEQHRVTQFSCLISCLKAVAHGNADSRIRALQYWATAVANLLSLSLSLRPMAESVRSSSSPAGCDSPLEALMLLVLVSRTIVVAGELLSSMTKLCDSAQALQQQVASQEAADHQTEHNHAAEDIEYIELVELLAHTSDACISIAKQLQGVAAADSLPAGADAAVLLQLADDGQRLALGFTAVVLRW